MLPSAGHARTLRRAAGGARGARRGRTGPRRHDGNTGAFRAAPVSAIVDLDLSAALALARDTTWATAHTRHTALPTPERPDGALIATAAPDQWAGHPVRTLDLT
ncbi:hypothetical protein PV417_17435 [Streptomyces sp. ME19-03-3]|nr:hypothetical protein [Streptomyces sp. ME19-03-3]